jgi:hypothetical protein
MIHAVINRDSASCSTVDVQSALSEFDPVLALCAERARQATACGSAETESAGEASFSRMCAIDRELENARPTTVEGALAAIALMQEQFQTFYADEEMYPGDRLMMGLIASVQSILLKARID